MTNEDYRQALLEIARKLTLLANGEEAAVEVPLAYPREATFAGLKYILRAPLNPAWQPSQYAKTFGRGHVLPDPSNGIDGAPLRSPAGYPLYYPVPTAKPVIAFADLTFEADDAVESYRAAVAASEAGQAQRDRETGADFSGGKSGEVEIKVEQG